MQNWKSNDNLYLQIIKSSQLLEMEVRNVGRVPGSFETHQTYTWVDAGGRTVSPPPEVDRVGRYDTAGLRKSGLMLLKDSDERKVSWYVWVKSSCERWRIDGYVKGYMFKIKQ